MVNNDTICSPVHTLPPMGDMRHIFLYTYMYIIYLYAHTVHTR